MRCSLAALAVLCAPALASAEEPGPITFAVELEYTRGEGAERCPGEEALHQEVARRVGYDPFAPGAGVPSGRIKVSLGRGPGGIVATFEHIGPDGERAYLKTYPVSGFSKSACEVAISGVAVELSFDLRMRRPKARPPEPPPPQPAPAPELPIFPPPPLPVIVPPSPKPKLRGELGVFGRIAGGVAPATTFGGGVHLGIEVFPFDPRPLWLSFAFEGRVDKPAPGILQDGWTVEAQLFEAALLGCGHVDQVRRDAIGLNTFACAEGVLGKARIAVRNAPGVSPGPGDYAAAGGRLGLELRVHERAAFRAQGDILPALVPVTVGVSGRREGFRSAGVWGSGSLAALLLF